MRSTTSTSPAGPVVGCATSDDATVRTLERALGASDATIAHVPSGAEAVGMLATEPALSVLVVDTRLPDLVASGLDRLLRDAGRRVPVLVLWDGDDPEEVLPLLDVGPSDHALRPADPRELRIRVEVLARRGPTSSPAARLRLDPHQVALCSGARCRLLTPTEYRLMDELLQHAGTLVRRETLVGAGWPPGARVAANTFDTYLYRLREHVRDLEPAVTIRTIRSLGYVLRERDGLRAG